MRSAVLAAAGGMLAAQVLLTAGYEPAAAGPQRARAYAAAPRAAAGYAAYVRWGIRLGLALLGVGLVNLVRAHRPGRRDGEPGKLPPYPFDPKTTQLILGERHNQDGSPSANPAWLTIPEAGMCTGILCVGATGSGKTSTVLNPAIQALIRLHASQPGEKLGGLIIDPKGNMGPDVRAMARACEREGDVVELSMPSARYNILRRPDLHPVALAGHLTDVFKNLSSGGQHDDFWANAAREFSAQALRLVALVERRPPTMADLYRVVASPEAFTLMLARAQAETPRLTDDEKEELASLEYWSTFYLQRLDDKTRTSIVANISQYASLFDVAEVRRCWCPRPADETFLGFDDVLEKGKIVVLSLPQSTLKHVGSIVGTMAKLSYQDSVLQRLARAEGANRTVGRACFLVADEYDVYCTQPGDGSFLAKCREARCAVLLATQSLQSLAAKLRQRADLDQLVAQFRTHVWLSINDVFTAEEAAKSCGRIERLKTTRSYSESAQRGDFSLLDRRVVANGAVAAAASRSATPREEYLFPPRAFLHLDTGQAIVRAFDGFTTWPAWVVYTKRLDEIALPRVPSWFDNEPLRS